MTLHQIKWRVGLWYYTLKYRLFGVPPSVVMDAESALWALTVIRQAQAQAQAAEMVHAAMQSPGAPMPDQQAAFRQFAQALADERKKPEC